jgi:hypothetical protein
VGDERSMTAREAFEADGGGFVVKGSGGKSSRLGDWAASFSCSDMSLAPGCVSESFFSVVAAEIEAVGWPPKKNVRTSIPVPRAKARMPCKKLGNMGVALRERGGEGGHSFVDLDKFGVREKKAQSAHAHRGVCGGKGVAEVSRAQRPCAPA